MKILVTGGAGFIGSNTVDALVAAGHRVAVLDDLSTGRRENIHTQAEFFPIDIRSPEINRVFEEVWPDAVYHLAAQIDIRRSLAEPALDYQINVEGSFRVIKAAVAAGVKKIIFTSSGGAIYGQTDSIPTLETAPARPPSPYGAAKLTVEQYLQTLSLSNPEIATVSLRYANVYGPRQNGLGEAGVVAIFTHRFLTEQPIIINGDGLQTRDFVYVSDAVAANLLALEKNQSGIFNVGTATETNVLTLAERIAHILGIKNIEIQYRPEITGEIFRSCLNSTLIGQTLGWKPRVSLDVGLKQTVDYFQKSM